MRWLFRNTDVAVLLTSVFLRRASFGLTNQVLALFLESAGILKPRIGLFMTLTLVGDSVISLLLTWFSDHFGRRAVMASGCVLMFGSGLVFAHFENFWILLLAAVLGVISTSGDETGPFKTVEEASLTQLTAQKRRPHTFALYGLLGTFGAATGSAMCGLLVDYWHTRLEWDIEVCYKGIFVVYSVFAAAKLVLALCLSPRCELGHKALEDECSSVESPEEIAETALVTEDSAASSSDNENTTLLPANATEDAGVVADDVQKSQWRKGLSAESKRHLYRLLVVFMLDSFGYGFMPPAWIVYYFRTTFKASPSSLGNLFFFTNLIDAVLSAGSAMTFWIFGPVKAILAAQLPSAIFFMAIPLCHLYSLAATLYFLFCACATMDVVPRQILLSTIIPAEDLIKVLGIVNISKTFARCLGPLFTGALAERNHLDIAYYVNGACLIIADTVLGLNFAHLDHEILQQHRQS